MFLIHLLSTLHWGGVGALYRGRLTSHATEYASQKLTEDPGPKDAFQGVEGGGAELWILFVYL